MSYERWEAADYAELQMGGGEGGELPPVHAAWQGRFPGFTHTAEERSSDLDAGGGSHGGAFPGPFTGRYGPWLLVSCHDPGASQRSSQL